MADTDKQILELLEKKAALQKKQGDKVGYLETSKQILELRRSMRPMSEKAGEFFDDYLAVNSTAPFERFARSTATGAAELADAVTGPAKAALNQLGFNYGTDTYSRAVTGAMDDMGWAGPETPGQRIVDEGVKLGMSTAPFIKGGQMLSQAVNPVVKGAGGLLASQPATQGAAAASAGAAAQGVDEKGLGPWWQFGAATVAGMAPGLLRGVTNTAKMAGPVDKGVAEVMSKLDLSGLPPAAIARISAKVNEALKLGELDSAAVSRMVDFERTGTTPTQASVTLDPVQKTEQMNLAKTGANSGNPDLGLLSQIENRNNMTLLSGLDDLADNQMLDLTYAGESAINPVASTYKAKSDEVGDLYRAARGTDGRAAPLDRSQFVNRVDDLLRENNSTRFLPEPIKNMINDIAYGQINSKGETFRVPFNVDTIDMLKTTLATAQRRADGNESRALSLVRQALDETQLQGGVSDEAMLAFDKARAARAALGAWEESAPGIKAIVDGASPDKFVESYILGSGEKANYKAVEKLVNEVKADPAAFQALKFQVAAWIRDQGAKQAQRDEGGLMGKLNSSSLNNALKKIGDRKLALFFNKDELELIKATNRVAYYDQYQPIGSAVNNSNSGTYVAGGLLGIASGLTPALRAVETTGQTLGGLLLNPMRARRQLSPDLSIAGSRGGGTVAAPLSLLAADLAG